MKGSKFRAIHYPLSTAHYSLRRYPISITRVERGFTHIAQAENLSRQTLKTDSQAAVWGHSELEHFEMALKTARVYAASTSSVKSVRPKFSFRSSRHLPNSQIGTPSIDGSGCSL